MGAKKLDQWREDFAKAIELLKTAQEEWKRTDGAGWADSLVTGEETE